jgi:uncharacterized protein
MSGNGPLPLLAPAITAFVGPTLRGPVNEPVAVNSFDHFRRHFGAHIDFSFVSHAVEQYFAHGGHAALVVRVANRARKARLEVPAGSQVLQLQARRPGSMEFLRVSVDYDRVEADPLRFNLVVQRVAEAGSELVEDQELYAAVSLDPHDSRYIGDALQDSELVQLAGPLPAQRPDATRPRHPGMPIPYLTASEFGTDGDAVTDYDIIGSNTAGTGLFALDRVDQVDLLCVPALPGRDIGSTTFMAAERYCERRKALLIWDPPASWTTPAAALQAMRGGALSSHNAVTYFPRVQRRDRAQGSASGLPAGGALAGMLANAARRGWWGSVEQCMRLVSGLVPAQALRDREASSLRRFGINAVRAVDGGACTFTGNVTLAGPNLIGRLWQRLDRRRVALFILSTLERTTRWAANAERDPDLGPKLERQMTTLLSALLEQGALAGMRAEQAFSVRAVISSTSDGGPVLQIGFALEQPGEFMVYEIVHGPRSSTIRALAGLEVRELVG